MKKFKKKFILKVFEAVPKQVQWLNACIQICLFFNMKIFEALLFYTQSYVT